MSTLSALTVVALLCIYFLTALRLQTLRSGSVSNELRAELLARAGLHLAIAQLKHGVGSTADNFCDYEGEPWYYRAREVDGSCVALAAADAEGADATISFASLIDENLTHDSISTVDVGNNRIGTLAIKVLDSAGQINLNDTNPRLAAILAKLPGLNASLANAIIAYRNSASVGGFTYEDQLMKVQGMTPAIFEGLRDYVTLHSWGDPKATDSFTLTNNTITTDLIGDTLIDADGDGEVDDPLMRSPVNINTAPVAVLTAVLAPVIGTADAATVANEMYSYIHGADRHPIFSWADFDAMVDGQIGVGADVKTKIKHNANPNREKPANATTEFCFHAGGYYDIEVLARVKTAGGLVLAKKTMVACVRIFDITQHTTKDDFRDEDVNNNGDFADVSIGEGGIGPDNLGDFDGSGVCENTNYLKVSWMNTCPVDESDDKEAAGYSGADQKKITPDGFPYRVVPNAIKLGFWDNFDEGAEVFGEEESRAWWEDVESPGFQVEDATGLFNYKYQPGDYCDYANVDFWELNKPTAAQVHTYDEGFFAGDAVYPNDDADKELWDYGSGIAPETFSTLNFSKFRLGCNGLSSDTPSAPWRAWDADNGFYLRVFNYDGVRASLGTPANFPGFKHTDPNPENTQLAGRGYNDIGMVELFCPGPDFAQLYLHPIGNVYGAGGAVKWGKYYAIYYPALYAACGSNANMYDYLYQRDKVYKSICRGGTIYHAVYGSDIGHKTVSYSIPSNYVGYVQLYSNNNQSLWDDVRIIDDEGRYAKHFVLVDDADFGSFHCNAIVPDGCNMYFVGNENGGTFSVGAVRDLSLWSEYDNFATTSTSSAYYPDVAYADVKEGAGIIAVSGTVDPTCTYAVRLTTTINNDEPVVPAIEDVSISYVPTTEIVYCYER